MFAQFRPTARSSRGVPYLVALYGPAPVVFVSHEDLAIGETAPVAWEARKALVHIQDDNCRSYLLWRNCKPGERRSV